MSEFIKLTGAAQGKQILVPHRRILCIAQGGGETEVFIEEFPVPMSWHVKETPEEIMALISGDGDMFTDPEVDDLRLDLAEAKSALASCRASLSFAQNMNDTLLRIIGTSTVKDIDGKADAPAPARSAFAFDEYPNAAAFPPTISITEYWKQRSDHYERLARKACAPAP